jgi:hypothetical protein
MVNTVFKSGIKCFFMHASISRGVSVCVYIRIHTYICIHMHIKVCVYICKCVYMSVCVCVYIYIHTCKQYSMGKLFATVLKYTYYIKEAFEERDHPV